MEKSLSEMRKEYSVAREQLEEDFRLRVGAVVQAWNKETGLVVDYITISYKTDDGGVEMASAVSAAFRHDGEKKY